MKNVLASLSIMQFGVASGVKLSDGLKSYGAGNEKDAVLKLDPEQQSKYDECITLLLAGGYFRARISSLDQFDKVRSRKIRLVLSFTLLPSSEGRNGANRNFNSSNFAV